MAFRGGCGFSGGGFLAGLLGFGLGASLASGSYLTGPCGGVPFQPTQMVPSTDGTGVIVYGPDGTYFVPYQNYHSSWNWLWGTPAYRSFFGSGIGFGRGGRRALFGRGGRFGGRRHIYV